MINNDFTKQHIHGRIRSVTVSEGACRLRRAGVAACAAAAILCCFSVGAPGAGPPGFAVWGKAMRDESDWVAEGKTLIQTSGLKEFKPPVQNLPPLTDAEKQPGYVCYVRHYLDRILDTSRPQRSEIGNAAVIFASQGEYEPVSFSLYALEPIQGATAKVSDLVSPTGAKIPSENIDIRVVKRLPFKPRDWKEQYTYLPMALEKKPTAAVAAEDTLQYWLTVYVPAAARPTVKRPTAGQPTPDSWTSPEVVESAYKGVFTVRIPGKPEARFDLRVAVLPIRLEQPRRVFGMCYLTPPRSRGLYPDNMGQHMVDMREHGMNSMWTWPDSAVSEDAAGNVRFDFSKPGLCRDSYFHHSLDQIVDAYVKAGFKNIWVCGSLDPLKDLIPGILKHPIGSPEFDKAYLTYIEQLRRHATEQRWPDYCLHPIDEPGGTGTMKEARYYYDLINRHFPQETTFADLGPWHGEDKDLIPRCDILCVGMPERDIVEKVKQAGKELWTYNVGSFGHDAKEDRLSRGLYAHKVGAGAVFQWVYQWWWTPDCERYTHPSPAGPIPTPAWEGVREGIDDERYIQTMESLAATVGLAHPAAAAATKTLQDILDPVPGGEKPALGVDRARYSESRTSVQFDVQRWQVARQILNLLAAKPVEVRDNAKSSRRLSD